MTALLLCLFLLTAAPPSRAAFATAGGRCFQGAILKGLGKTELAELAFSECKAPTPPAAPEEPKAKQHLWSWAATAAKDIVAVAGFALVAAACIGVALVVFFWLLLNCLIHIPGIRNLGVAKRFPRPSLTVASLDDTGVDKHLGPAVAALVRARVGPDSTSGLRLVTGHTALGESLKPLSEVSSETKAAMSIVSFFLSRLPDRDYEAGGALQTAGRSGRGISIELTRDGKDHEAETLWADDYGAPAGEEEAFQFLAVPAAAWLEHRVAFRIRNRKNLPREPKVWMLFNAGLTWQRAGKPDKAKPLYEAGLDLDPNDSWCKSNLGLIELLARNYERADELLSAALTELGGKTVPTQMNADWYRVTYNLAALHAEWAAKLRADPRGDETGASRHRAVAHEYARDLVQSGLEELLSWQQVNERLDRTLQNVILPAALCIYGETQEPSFDDGLTPDYPWGPFEEEWGKRGLLTNFKSGLGPETVLNYVAALKRQTATLRYNLACAWTQQGKAERGLRMLAAAMNRASVDKRKELVKHARNDPSLAPLRGLEWRENFERALAGKPLTFTPAPTPTGGS